MNGLAHASHVWRRSDGPSGDHGFSDPGGLSPSTTQSLHLTSSIALHLDRSGSSRVSAARRRWPISTILPDVARRLLAIPTTTCPCLEQYKLVDCTSSPYLHEPDILTSPEPSAVMARASSTLLVSYHSSWSWTAIAEAGPGFFEDDFH